MTTPSRPKQAIKLFYSYSHRDEPLRVELDKHLALLKRRGILAEWHDRMIEAGDDWRSQIDQHLEAAQIILLLISADFMASDYCYDVEMKRALERHETGEARVIPVILRWVDTTGAPFAHIQALPKDARPVSAWPDRDEAFDNVSKGIRRVINTLWGQTGTAEPFAGGGTPAPAESQAPAVSGGLFMTRLINPQQRGASDIVSTVWLNVVGDTQYVVDSIRVYDMMDGVAGPVAGVALAPDAEYRFTYADATDRTEALNPALSVGPETRRQASFTLSTAPEKALYGLGSLALWLQYQTSDGRTGKLLLAPPSPDGLFLSKLVGQPVHVVGNRGQEQIVTPSGGSQGVDEQSVPPFQFRPVEVSSRWDMSQGRLERARAEWGEVLRQRAPLQQKIVRDDRVAKLIAELSQGSRLAADLCGAIGNEQCTRALLALLADEPWDELGVFGLCVRHIANPDPLLADHVLDRLLPVKRPESPLASQPVVIALACYPDGRWLDAMLALCEGADSLAPRALPALQDRMAAEDKARVVEYCWQLLRRRPAEYSLVSLLVDFVGSGEEVAAKLRELPYEPGGGAGGRTAAEEAAFREQLVKSVVDYREGRRPSLSLFGS